jgi:hypothetical protein
LERLLSSAFQFPGILARTWCRKNYQIWMQMWPRFVGTDIEIGSTYAGFLRKKINDTPHSVAF